MNMHTPGSQCQAGVAIQRCWMVMPAAAGHTMEGAAGTRRTALEQMVLMVFGVCTGRSHPSAGSDL